MRSMPCDTADTAGRCARRRELALVAARQPLAADVIADAGAAPLHRPFQHRCDAAAKPIRGGAVEVAAQEARVQFRLEQRLVRVDVTDARNDALVEQHRFERATGAAQLGRASRRRRGRTAPDRGGRE